MRPRPPRRRPPPRARSRRRRPAARRPHALARLFTDVLALDPDDLRGTTALPFSPDELTTLRRVLTEFNLEELVPTYALANPNRGTAHAVRPWLCLLKKVPTGWDLDRPHGDHTQAHWVASPMAKFERLLRETNVPIGVLSNDTELRLLYAPAGEGAGVLSFPLAVLLGPNGELVLGALVMLFGRARWFDNTPDGAPARDRDKTLDCFETFPFPPDWERDAALDEAGRACHEYRAQLMVANDGGLTATYNRFHSPDEGSPGILALRRLHDAMDRAVLAAYGWTDLAPTCEFLLEYEAAEEEGGGRKKKPWRYRWPDALRDEVLARLLALNGQRAAEERAAAAAKAAAEATAAAEAKALAKAARVQGKATAEKPQRAKRGAKASPPGDDDGGEKRLPGTD